MVHSQEFIEPAYKTRRNRHMPVMCLNLSDQSKSVFLEDLYELMFPEQQCPALRFSSRHSCDHWGIVMSTWKSIATAPLSQDVELQVGDRFGEHVLNFPCRLTEIGWVNANLNVPLSPSVRPLAWRPWKKRR
jgi:hypothetical protein